MTRGTSQQDTIAAVATPPGRGGIGIVRVSGNRVKSIARELLGRVPEARYATLASFKDEKGDIIDDGIALYFPSPKSFTGEDVLELQGHGGPVVMDLLLQRVVRAGARIALPGEFSERAFLNDKIDLSQAEAIADLIDSVSEKAARSAVRSLQGEFSSRIHHLGEMLVNLRMYVEAAIDFPEEEIDFLADSRITGCLDEIEARIASNIEQAGQGALLREGISLVIAGRPNAGKSSLMNCLTGKDSSIVTTVPGTTRDVVNEYIHLDGIPLRVVDTAGIRPSRDEVEAEGVRRALKEVQNADQILVVVDIAEHGDDWHRHASKLMAELGGESARMTVVLNKIDLVEGFSSSPAPIRVASISARTGAGIEDLKKLIKSLAGFDASAETPFMARRRHVDAMQRAMVHLREGRRQLQHNRAGELLAEELRGCHECLCEITGEFTSDDLLGKIFASFCIGK
jgi:tRNA modification GTPase